MENSVHVAIKIAGQKLFEKLFLVEIINDLAIDKIPELVGPGQIIDRNDLVHAALVERLDQIGTNKPGSTRHNGVHKFSSAQFNAASSSARVTTAVPSLPTTTPAATLAT